MERLSLSKHQWEDIVSQWQNSGETMSNFCKKKKISKSSLGYWAVKFRKEKNADFPGFVKLPFSNGNHLGTKNCEILFANGTRMFFYEKPDYRDLKQLFT